ncbi:MAG: T9SS type A sorting domain-containing protein [Bacteroidales bacterium]|nr:T9SS type A sorting domain-containing protein [Bacteroidales bacterium]
MTKNLTLFLAIMLVSLLSIQAQNALNFDGTNDYVNINDNDALDLTTNYTIEAWIMPESFISMGGIVCKYHTPGSNGYLLRLAGTAPYSGLTFDEMNTQSGILTSGVWHHIAAVNDNGTRRLYLNGIEQTLTGTPLVVTANIDPLTIGVDYLDIPRFFDGNIDEVRIWNDVRTEQEIKDNMNSEIDPASANLVAYYNFNEISGSALPDITPNLHNGTLNNMIDEDWTESYAMVVPQNLSSDGCTSSLQWEAPVTGGIENYYLEIAEDITFATYVTGYNPYKDMGTATSEIYSTLTYGNTYYARVRAFKSSVGDVGASSDILTFTASDDVENPVLVVSADVIAFLDATGNLTITASDIVSSATDNCIIADTTLSQSVFDCSNVGTPINIDVTLSDVAGNTHVQVSTIDVRDNINPTLAVQNLTVQLDATGNATISAFNVVTNATDNCIIADTTLSQSTFNQSDVGILNVDVTLSDVSGNTHVQVSQITVVDLPLIGTYAIGQGTSDDYPTLYDALEDIKLRGVDGAVVFELSADYNYISDAYPVSIQSFTGASEINTLTIKPAAGTAHFIESNADYIIKINADYIIIDGSNNGTDSRDLTISNISANNTTYTIFAGYVVKNTYSNSGENITVKNCIIKGGSKENESVGIGFSDCVNVTIENNLISRARLGILSYNGSDVTILKNEIGSENSSEYLHYGISSQFASAITISGNKIYNLIDNQDFDAIRAIAINDLTGNVIISDNYIDNLIHTGNNVVQAIGISDCTPSDMRIFNNRISNIASNSFENNFPAGIAINCPAMTSGMYIMHNSINIPENTTYGIGTGADNTMTGGINIGAGSGISFVNNIISNTLGERTGATYMTFAAAVLVNSDVSPFMLNDKNLFYAAGNNDFSFMAINTNGGLSLSEWKTWTGGGVFSIFDEALFTSDDDLNLQACSPAIAHAEYRSYYEFDIEGNARDTQYPAMGAYEYEKVQATNLLITQPVKGQGYISWTQGNGCNAVVFMKQGYVLPETPSPVNGTTYASNLDFGSGDQIGTTGWYCVFNGFGSGDFWVNGADGEYTAMVCEYYGSEGNEIYLTETAIQNPNEGYLSSDIEKLNSQLINIYPNPATGKVTINFIGISNFGEVVNVSVNGITGKVVFNNQHLIKNNQLEIDLSNYGKGVYFVKIEYKQGIITKKLILK